MKHQGLYFHSLRCAITVLMVWRTQSQKQLMKKHLFMRQGQARQLSLYSTYIYCKYTTRGDSKIIKCRSVIRFTASTGQRVCTTISSTTLWNMTEGARTVAHWGLHQVRIHCCICQPCSSCLSLYCVCLQKSLKEWYKKEHYLALGNIKMFWNRLVIPTNPK